MDCLTTADRIADSASQPRGELLAHLAACESCRELYQGYESLRALAPESAPDGGHLSSADLAAWAVAPGSPTGSVRLHLESCTHCGSEYELVRAAVVTARPLPRVRHAPTSAPHRTWRWAAAAALVAVVSGAAWVARTERLPRELTVSGDRLAGERTLRATDSILIETTAVDSGGSVKLQSGDRVAFRDGFSVGSDAALSVSLKGKRSS